MELQWRTNWPNMLSTMEWMVETLMRTTNFRSRRSGNSTLRMSAQCTTEYITLLFMLAVLKDNVFSGSCFLVCFRCRSWAFAHPLALHTLKLKAGLACKFLDSSSFRKWQGVAWCLTFYEMTFATSLLRLVCQQNKWRKRISHNFVGHMLSIHAFHIMWCFL